MREPTLFIVYPPPSPKVSQFRRRPHISVAAPLPPTRSPGIVQLSSAILLSDVRFITTTRTTYYTNTQMSFAKTGREAIRYIGSRKPMVNPSPAIELIKKNPPIVVKDRVTFCDGGNKQLGHPRVYLNLDAGQNTCGYCGQVFNHNSSSHSH